jgi:hypothetical protein
MIRIILAAAFLILAADRAFAAPVTLTYSSVGTGSIGATSFTNAPFTITELLDSANRMDKGFGFFTKDNSALIVITGVGTFSFTMATQSYQQNADISLPNGAQYFARDGVQGTLMKPPRIRHSQPGT